MQCRHLFRLYTGQVLHFFIFINHKNCLRITFFMFQWVSKMCNWLISQWLLITFQSSRRPWCNKKQTKFLSFSWNSPQKFCRTPFNILQNTFQYFCRAPLVFLQNTSHYFWRTLLFNDMTYKSIIFFIWLFRSGCQIWGIVS